MFAIKKWNRYIANGPSRHNPGVVITEEPHNALQFKTVELARQWLENTKKTQLNRGLRGIELCRGAIVELPRA